MTRKNPNVTQKVVKAPNLGVEFALTEDTHEKQEKKAKEAARESKVHAIAARSREFNTFAERIAQHKLFYKNHIWQGAREAFPFHPALRMVDRYFPYAEGGPLYIDEPSRVDDLKQYEPKIDAMKKLGHRYLLLKPGMTELEVTEALAEMAEE